MILAINKMSRGGEKKVLLADLQKVLAQPYNGNTMLSEDNFRPCFLDAQSYLDSLNISDAEIQEELYEYELTLADLQAIYDILLSWYNKKKWNESGRSIWDWKTMKEQLRYDCNRLAYLIAKKEVYGDDLPVYFYDSY